MFRGCRWLPLERPDGEALWMQIAVSGRNTQSVVAANEYIRTPRGPRGGVRSNRNPLKVPASPFEAQLGAGSLHLPPSGSFQQVGGFGDAGGGFCHPGGKLAGPNRVLGGQDLAQIRDQRLRGGL